MIKRHCVWLLVYLQLFIYVGGLDVRRSPGDGPFIGVGRGSLLQHRRRCFTWLAGGLPLRGGTEDGDDGSKGDDDHLLNVHARDLCDDDEIMLTRVTAFMVAYPKGGTDPSMVPQHSRCMLFFSCFHGWGLMCPCPAHFFSSFIFRLEWNTSTTGVLCAQAESRHVFFSGLTLPGLYQRSRREQRN